MKKHNGEKIVIGSGLRHKPQQFDRRDPWPKVPFVEPDLPTAKGAIFIVIGLVILGCVLAAVLG